MKKSQLNAISYSYQKKQREQEEKLLTCLAKWDAYKCSKYKTMKGYIKHVLKINDVNTTLCQLKDKEVLKCI